MSGAETPEERAARVERLYDKCARRGGGSMADVETLRNDVRAFAAALAAAESRAAQLRHIVDNQAHRIQSGPDRIEQDAKRITELEAQVELLGRESGDH